MDNTPATQINYTDLTQTKMWKDYQQGLNHRNIVAEMWFKTICFAASLYIFMLFYIVVQSRSFTANTFSLASAGTAAILIGLSFGLSGFCYYFDFLDKKIAYRKYLGLVGFWLALTYSVSLLLINPERYFYGFFDNLFSADFILGLTSMTIFTFMAVISNNWAMIRMGVTRWRYGLRLGYFAYLLLIVRAVVLEHQMWTSWLQQLNALPPPRLIVSIFAAFILLLRLSMMVKLKSLSPLPK